MTFPRARLTVAIVLFACWLTYLLTLVLLSRHTIVLSRPQFRHAHVWAIASLTGDSAVPDEIVTIQQLIRSVVPGVDAKAMDGQKIRVKNLKEAGPQGYQGPGPYILALTLFKQDANPVQSEWLVTAIPVSPGYSAAFVSVTLVVRGKDLPDLPRTARIASETLGIELADATTQVNELKKKAPWVTLTQSVRRDKAVEFINRLNEDKNAGVDVHPSANDVRIYPLTPETKEQLDGL